MEYIYKEIYMDPNYFYPLIETNIFLSVFSILGSLLIIILFLVRKNLQSFIFYLVFHLSITQIINSIGNLLSIDKLINDSNKIICNFQSFIIIFTDFSTLAWILIISYSIYDLMCNFNQINVIRNRLFLMIGYIIPIIISSIIMLVNIFYNNLDNITDYDKYINACWCFINTNTNTIIIFIVYSIYWTLIIINIIIILKVIKFLKKNLNFQDENSIKIQNMCTRLYMYQIITIFSFIFATFHRAFQFIFYGGYIDNQTTGNKRIEIVLYLLHGMSLSFRGFMYFIIYGYDKKVKSEIIILFKKCFYRDKDYININEL